MSSDFQEQERKDNARKVDLKGEKGSEANGMKRRDFVLNAARGMGLVFIGAGSFFLGRRAVRASVPMIYPGRCKACGECQTYCVRNPSAVKSVNNFQACGYCKYCYGYFSEDPAVNPDARVCPYGALLRSKISEFEFEYTIDEKLCHGCGACVRRCVEHGNGSLALEVRGRFCLECNRCSIIANCPNNAISKVECDC